MAIGGCGPKERLPNVLLVTFDTTRADRIGCYGNQRIETPTLDGLAREGIRFANAMSTAPITAPSHSTILTGRYPIAHGFRDNGLFILGEEQVTLAEILRENGYATAAAVGAFPLIARFGLNQGFDLFDDHLTGAFEDYTGQRAVAKDRLFFDERRAAQVNEAVIPWLSENAGKRPFFTWVHYFDPHQPHEPESPWAETYADDLYNGEIAYADAKLGYLLEHLRRLGELDRTLVVMTADHGEGLGDHGEVTHALLAYNSTLHVPLIIRPPQGVEPRGVVVEHRVGTVDLTPTIVDLLGLEPSDTFQGRSLAPLWRDPSAPPPRTPHYAENLSPRLSHGWGELRVLFDGSYKYIHGPRPELFDLARDPAELHDLAADEPDTAAAMRTRLQAFLDRYSVSGVSTVEDLDEETRRRLAALGYIQAKGNEGQEITERLLDGGVPPSDQLRNANDLSAAKHLLFQERFVDALRFTTKLLDAAPESPLYLELHASALIELGRIEQTWPIVEKLAELGAASPALTRRTLAARFTSGDRDAAHADLERQLASSDTAEAADWWLLAGFERDLGRPPEERQALDRALEKDPRYVPALLDLAIAHDVAGERDAAEIRFLEALELAPYYAKGHYNYGTFLFRSGNAADAVRRFERATQLAPRYLKAHLALVAAHVAEGRRELAETSLARLEQLAPRSTELEAARALVSNESRIP
jgi:arylsulfatase A-like enzyme/thioredoxin-like negative regulator of GroEL